MEKLQVLLLYIRKNELPIYQDQFHLITDSKIRDIIKEISEKINNKNNDIFFKTFALFANKSINQLEFRHFDIFGEKLSDFTVVGTLLPDIGFTILDGNLILLQTEKDLDPDTFNDLKRFSDIRGTTRDRGFNIGLLVHEKKSIEKLKQLIVDKPDPFLYLFKSYAVKYLVDSKELIRINLLWSTAIISNRNIFFSLRDIV